MPVAPHHRQFLNFAFKGEAYQFCVLPLAPRIFTRCIAAALSPLQSKGFRILPYLNNWLICSATREQAICDTTSLLNHVTQLGLTVNFAKSCLVPSQRVGFIGVVLDSLMMRASPSPQRVDDILNLVSRVWKGTWLTYGLFLRLLGKLTAGSDNTLTVYHVNYQGGTRSSHSLREAQKLLQWASPRTSQSNAFTRCAERSCRPAFLPKPPSREVEAVLHGGPDGMGEVRQSGCQPICLRNINCSVT